MRAIHKSLKAALLAAIFCAVLGGCASSRPTQVTVLTYNIYHGENAEGESNLDAVAEIINAFRPDLVALQEVDNKTRRARGLDLTAELAERTGMEGIFGKAMNYSGGGYGEAVLSSLPVITTQNHPLPHTPNAEPRTALEIRVRLPDGRELLFVGTHLDHLRDPENRMMQASRLRQQYADCELPVVLAGDLNATAEAEPMKLLLEDWACAGLSEMKPTYPATLPTRKIDYILYKPKDKWRVVDIRVIDEKVSSDHCPVLAVLELRPDRD